MTLKCAWPGPLLSPVLRIQDRQGFGEFDRSHQLPRPLSFLGIKNALKISIKGNLKSEN